MKLLELLKKNHPDEADEENDETEENEDQEESEPKGLGSGLFSKLREIGDNAGETLGRVLKRGGNDDEGEDGEDDETISIPFQAEAGNANNAAAASSAPATSEAAGPDAPPAQSAGAAVPTAPPAQGLSAAGLAAIDLTGEGPAQESGEKPEAASIDLSPKEGASDKEDSLGLSDLFEKKPEIDQNLRELAEAQEDVSVQELAQELRAFLAHLEGRPEE